MYTLTVEFYNYDSYLSVLADVEKALEPIDAKYSIRRVNLRSR